jgi:hypothetical protein
MEEHPTRHQDHAGVATAEKGEVILDGPDGVAVTMTPEAAVETAASLIAAAERALDQGSAAEDEEA